MLVQKCNYNVLGSLTLPGPTAGAYSTDRICIPKKVIKVLHGRLVQVGKTLTDLQILGCEFHQCVWRSGSARTRWGSSSRPPNRFVQAL